MPPSPNGRVRSREGRQVQEPRIRPDRSWGWWPMAQLTVGPNWVSSRGPGFMHLEAWLGRAGFSLTDPIAAMGEAHNPDKPRVTIPSSQTGGERIP
jgi:hypothetical protein